MKQQVFQQLSDLIYRESGIVIPLEKAVLLGNRVQKRLRALQIESEEEYLQIIEVDADGSELVNLIDAVSTNTTFFYREPSHFEIYRKVLNGYRAEGRPSIKVWCAAASSGEEPYTLAIETAEHLKSGPPNVKLLATDICTAVLKRALTATYRDKAVEQVPADRLRQYFERIDDGDETSWKVKPEAARLVLFKKLNLVQIPYPLQGPVDVIFCRNVMIYFDTATRGRIIEAFYSLLRSGGYLFLSHSENLLGIEHNFKRRDNSVFQKP